MKRSDALINSMTKKERADPQLLIKDKTARSRLERIAKGSGRDYMEAVDFMSEFTKMGTMMQRIQKQAAGAQGANGEGGEPSEDDISAAMGNRASRRNAKKGKGRKKSGGGGFG